MYTLTLKGCLAAGCFVLLAGSLFTPRELSAQQRGADSATVIAGKEYEAGPLEESLLGRSYRDLWTTPVRVPVLRPDTLGGLTPTGTGGGFQTLSLVLRGGDGREYRFRLAQKAPGKGLPEDLKQTLVHQAIQDQISSLNPAGALLAARVLDAAGVLHATPGLYVMPDDPFLGEYRDQFAGRLGLFEERPEENEERGITFAGANEIEGTEDFLDALEDEPGHELHTREYLAARLVDLFLGDWDRHADQWRWARFEQGDGRQLWRPIPRDRDYALADYDGLLIQLASSAVPQTERFTESYAGTIPGLAHNATLLDRRLLGGVPRPAWDSVATMLRARLTDPILDEAVDRLPLEYRAAVGADLRRILRARRDALPEAADALYERLALAPDLHGTDRSDSVRVERLDSGALRVRIWTRTGGEPYRDRVFVPSETEEVRIDLHGGDDVAVVEGSGSEILVRIIGGGGDDRLEDRGRDGRTAFYDSEGDNRFVRGPDTVVDQREYRGIEPDLAPNAPIIRDWGAEFSPFTPFVDWRPFPDLVVGGGPTWTRYGFRRYPWASIQTVRALWAPLHTRFGLQYLGRFRQTGSDVMTEIQAQVTNLEAAAFYGFGNGTEEILDPDEYIVWAREFKFEPRIIVPLTRGAAVSVGGELRSVDPDPQTGSPAALLGPPGAEGFTAAGFRSTVGYERLDDPALPKSGIRAEVRGAGFPVVWGAGGSFAKLGARTAGYLSPVSGGPTLALRAGGEWLTGGFPFQYAAFLGGTSTLRGYRPNRFAGDASIYGTAELRQVLTRAKLLTRGNLGVFALADAGRVWNDGVSEGDWHTAVGGGVFFSTLGRTLTLTYANGSEGMFYLGISAPW